MYGYAGSSAAAATLTPFSRPQQNTNPAGLATQSATTTNSGGTQTSSTVDTIIQQILADINKALEPDTVNSGISAFATVPSIILSGLSALSAGSNSAATAANATVAALTDVGVGLGEWRPLSARSAPLRSAVWCPPGWPGQPAWAHYRCRRLGARWPRRMAPPPTRRRSASRAKPAT